MSAKSVWSRTDTWCAFAIAAIAIAASAMSITTLPVGVFQDDGMYVVLARSLAEGDGYRFTNLPNAPSGTHYPPLYPLWLALLWKLGPAFPANVQLFKLGNSLLLGAGAVGTFVLARRRLEFGTWTAALTSAAGAICAPLVWLSAMVLSEPAFLAALFPVILLAERALVSGKPRTAAAAGAAAGALGLLRSLGMFIVPALALLLIVQRRWRAASCALIAGALVLAPWQLWTMAHAGELPPALVGKYGSYFGWVLDGMRDGGATFVAAVLKTNARYSAEFLTGSLGLATAHWTVRTFAVVVLLGLLMLGARELVRRTPVSAVFLAMYVAIVLVWPFPPHRFFWVIMPMLVLTSALGMRHLLSIATQRGRLQRGIALSGAAVLFALYARPNVLGKPRWDVADEEVVVADRSRAVAQWVGRYTKPDDIVATEDDILVHLYTGRRAIPLATFTPQEYLQPQTTVFASATLDTLLRTYPIRWVLPVSVMHINTALALTQRDPAILDLRYGLKLGAVFEHVRSPRPAAAPAASMASDRPSRAGATR